MQANDPVATSCQSMLSGFDLTMAGHSRQSAIPVRQKLPGLLPRAERLQAFVQARMTSPNKENVVLAATADRLLAYRDGDAGSSSMLLEAT